MEYPNIKHTDEDIVNTLYWDFPKVFDKIIEYLDNQNKNKF